MQQVKALVVMHDEETSLAVDDVLSTMNHPYEAASDLAKARSLLPTGGFTYVLLDYRLPARPGGQPREQNAQYLLTELREMAGDAMPPVVVIADQRPAMNEEDMIRWTADMVQRGATDFICRPLPTGGRTLDRVISKVLRKGRPRPKPLIGQAGRQVPSPAIPASATPSEPTADECGSVPNDPVTLDEFMARFCEHRSKENRMHRKRALLAAARHKTVRMPPLAADRKHGQSNKYFTHDLLNAWQGYRDEGVELPQLLPDFSSLPTTA